MGRKPARNGGPTKNNDGPPSASSKTSDTDDGDVLWDHLVQNVQPIARTDTRPPVELDVDKNSKSAEAPSGSSGRGNRTKFAATDITIGGSVRHGLADQKSAISETHLGHGDSPGVDKRTATRFRRGQMQIDGSLDLHGQNQESAKRLLTSFLLGEQSAGSRCVIVVTGKGRNEDWSPGVLKEAVPRWLNSSPLHQIVLSFTFAQPRHGGSGALYVLLKRSKNAE
jgi:DNA-nicking Smr family endonuclease